MDVNDKTCDCTVINQLTVRCIQYANNRVTNRHMPCGQSIVQLLRVLLKEQQYYAYFQCQYDETLYKELQTVT